MKINTTRFGELEVNQNNILMFPQGLPGFEECTRFQFFHEEKDQPMVFWLQSLDQPDVAFSLVDPTAFGINFQLNVTGDEMQLLEAKDVKELAVMVMVYQPIQEKGNKLTSSSTISANITGPLLINISSKRGMQKVLVPGAGTVSAEEVEKLGC